ncbi:hypothetical protein CC2G_004026 [Coprinopsis cinerea AmutBmut pab1-1]|nr:hypothetical protein CC2G_004026 [Coprinopsis cinerea AmutBmut pab1-1]
MDSQDNLSIINNVINRQDSLKELVKAGVPKFSMDNFQALVDSVIQSCLALYDAELKVKEAERQNLEKKLHLERFYNQCSEERQEIQRLKEELAERDQKIEVLDGPSTWSIPFVFGIIRTAFSRSFERYPRQGNPSSGY